MTTKVTVKENPNCHTLVSTTRTITTKNVRTRLTANHQLQASARPRAASNGWLSIV